MGDVQTLVAAIAAMRRDQDPRWHAVADLLACGPLDYARMVAHHSSAGVADRSAAGRAVAVARAYLEQEGTMRKTYTWEVQRRHAAGLWSSQAPDRRGYDASDESPEVFATKVAELLRLGGLEGEWRLVVWDTPGVGRHPVAIVNGSEG